MYPRNSTTPLYFSVRDLDGTPRTTDVDFRYISGTSAPTAATNAATHLEGGVWRISPTASESNQDAWAIYPIPASETDDLVWGAIGNYPTRKSSGFVAASLADMELFPDLEQMGLDYGAGELLASLFGNVEGDVTNLTTAAINSIRNAITGGAYALDTDANGRIRLVSGTGAGEISLSSGLVTLAGVTHTGAVIPAVTEVTNAVATDAASRTASQADVSGLAEKTDLPTNFSSLGINGDGHLLRVVLVDTTTENSDMRGTDGANTTAPDNAGINTAATAATAANNKLPADTATRLGHLDVDISTRSTLDAAGVWGHTPNRTLTALSSSLIDSIWHRVRATSSPPAGSFGEFLDAKVSEAGGEGGGGDSNWSDEQRDAVLQRTARVDGMIEDVGGDQFTEKALSQAPTGDATAGAGSEQVTLTLNDGEGNPIDGVAVWITTSAASHNTGVVAGTRFTDGMGQVTFMLDPGTYYRWAQKSGKSFTNPQEFEVTA